MVLFIPLWPEQVFLRVFIMFYHVDVISGEWVGEGVEREVR